MKTRKFRAFLLAAVVALVYALTGVGRESSAQPAAGIQAPATAATESGTHSIPSPAAANAAEASPQTAAHHTLPKVLFILLLMLIMAKAGGDLMERVGQPAVLGELIFGIILGNLALLRLPGLDALFDKIIHDPEVAVFITLLSEIGVILLLFEVGLESTVREMLSVGVSALVVAILGVIVPMGLGFGTGMFFLPKEPWTVHLFLGAVMAATSVGITARVLKDLGKMDLRESKIILGAAVIDDILGLIVLAVAQGAVVAQNSGTSLEINAILMIVLKAVGFFVGAVILGSLISKRLYTAASYLQGQGVLLSLTLGWCFLIAYLGTLVGVAPIVGAFAAGLVLEDTTVKDWHGRESGLEDLLRPLLSFLVPVFFVYTGMNVQLETFSNAAIFGFAAVLTICAILGKQVCAFGVRDRSLNRLAIGIGMIPRGEVGLIVANIGRTMKTSEGHPIISANTFSASVIMVVVTTMITPPALKWALERKRQSPDPDHSVSDISTPDEENEPPRFSKQMF